MDRFHQFLAPNHIISEIMSTLSVNKNILLILVDILGIKSTRGADIIILGIWGLNQGTHRSHLKQLTYYCQQNMST